MTTPLPPQRARGHRGAHRRPRQGLGPALVLATLLLPGLGPTGAWSVVGRSSPEGPMLLGLHAAPRLDPEMYQVYGTLRGIEPSGSPGSLLTGVSVEALARPCAGLDNCTWVATTQTDAPGGNFSLALAPGDYFLVTNRTDSFGGTETVLNLTSDAGGPYGPLPLAAEPFVPYGNASFVLPGWNNLSAYAANCNARLPCHTGAPAVPYGSQQPLLSWTADGAVYVNASDELVFYSFASQAVRAVAPWRPLYDNLMQYEGIENTEWVTADGSYVYEFGCPTVCNVSSPIEFYAVNTTTGENFSTTLRNLTEQAFSSNGQVDLIGENGNLSIAAFDTADGQVVGYDLWNRTQWTLGELPFFEANNLYWIPLWGSYLDVRAENSSLDQVAQVELVGPAPGTSLQVVATVQSGSGYPVNGVNGVAYNLSSQTLVFTSQNRGGDGITYRASLNGAGDLASVTAAWGSPSSHFGSWPNNSAYPNVAASEHRPSLVVDGPVFAAYTNGWFENQSAFVDPGTGVWYDTNVSFDHTEGPPGHFRQSVLGPAAMEGLFYNTSYAIVPWSYDCRTNQSRCPIQGNVTPSDAVGTVWWSWREGEPEFPFPTDAPLAEVAPPADASGLQLNASGQYLVATWNASTTPSSELLGYRLTYAPTLGGSPRSVWVPGDATRAELGPVLPSTDYVVELQAWNLHGHSPGLVGSGPSSVQTGWLNLTVSPSFATVTVDNEPVTLSGGFLALPLSVGAYWVNATAPGYLPFSTSANVTFDNVTDLDVVLSGVAPVLLGNVTPARAQVTLDGDPVPVLGNGSFRVTTGPGQHELDASAPGYLPLSPISLTLSYGETVHEALVLNRSYGWLAGTVSPANALAIVNHTVVNLTWGQLNVALPTGLYWVDLYDAGYHPLALGPYNVTAFNVTRFTAALVPYNGTLQLNVTPSNATAELDHQPLPLANGSASVALVPGPHNLSLSASGYDPLLLEPVVVPNETLVMELRLAPSLGWIVGSARPADASLWLDGRPGGIDAFGGFNLTAPPGPHTLEVAAPGYRTAFENLTVADHAASWTNLTLLPSPGSVAPDWPVLGAAVAAGVGVAAAAVLWARPPKPSRLARPSPPSAGPLPRGPPPGS